MTSARHYARQNVAKSTNQDTQAAVERTKHGVSSRESVERSIELEQTQERQAMASSIHLRTEESVFQQNEVKNTRQQ